MSPQKCEWLGDSRTACRHPAVWLVRVGERVTDEQKSCTLHLGNMCFATYAAEGRASAIITVRRVPQ